MVNFDVLSYGEDAHKACQPVPLNRCTGYFSAVFDFPAAIKSVIDSQKMTSGRRWIGFVCISILTVRNAEAFRHPDSVRRC
jgi:hypothetical protein